MNKIYSRGAFAILLVVALSWQVISADDVPKIGSDAEEVAPLNGEGSQVLKDFCIDVRKLVTGDLRSRGKSLNDVITGTMKSKLNAYTSKARSFIANPEDHLKQVDELLLEAQQSISKNLVDKPIAPFSLAKDLQSGFRHVLSHPRSSLEKAENYLLERQRSLGRRLQEKPLEPSSFVKSAFNLVSKASSAIQEQLKSLKAGSMERIGALLGETCDVVNGYEKQIESLFEEAKKKDSALASMELGQVDCLTLASVQSVLNACKASAKKSEETSAPPSS